jgi:hypothetical protein
MGRVQPVERDLLRQQTDQVVALGIDRVQYRALPRERELRVPGDAGSHAEDQRVVGDVPRHAIG